MKDKIKTYKTAIACLFEELQHESYEGTATWHMCDCQRKGCRRDRCCLCIIDDVQKLITDLQNSYKV